ncbi:hypothetical protein AB4084_22640, partial [Lysobacter sp. 2RAB21]
MNAELSAHERAAILSIQSRYPRRRRLVCALALALLPGLAAADGAPAAAATVAPAHWAALKPPIARDARLEKRIADLLAKMSVEEKVGQIVQADINSATPEDVRKYHIGS